MPTKDVNKLLKGVNDCILAAVDDAGAASPAQVGDTFPLLSCGFLDENAIQSESKKLTQKEHGGNLLQLGEIASVNINSLSGSGASITAAKKFKNAQCNIYGFGSQQSHKITKFLMNVETPNDLKKNGKSVIQFSTEKKVSPDENLGTLGSSPTAFASDAAARYRDFVNNIRQENLVFAILPYLGNFGQTTKLYDASDNRILGNLVNGPAWGSAPLASYSKLTFDGVNDYGDFGDVLDDDGVSDFAVEFWVKILSSDSLLVQITGNKNSGTNDAGWMIYRTTGNKIGMKLSDGSASAAIVSTTNLLQNVWKHVFISIDRNGNGTVFQNGVADGTVAVSSILTGSNANSFLIGRDLISGSAYGNFELGALRVYKFGAGNIPSNIGTIASDHYNAEKAIFGL